MGIVVYNGDSYTYGDELEGSCDPRGWEYDSHHHHTYAHKLSHLLGKKYVNLAHNGSSNIKIFRRTLEFLQTTTKDIDLLVISWSGWGRFELCEPVYFDHDRHLISQRESDMNQVIPLQKSLSMSINRPPLSDEEIEKVREDDYDPFRESIIETYISRVLTIQTQISHGLMYMKHIQWLCDKLNIRVIQSIIHRDLYSIILKSLKGEGYEEYRKEVSKSLRFLREECRIGMDKYTDMFSIAYHQTTVKPRGHPDEEANTIFANMLYEIIKEKGWFDVSN